MKDQTNKITSSIKELEEYFSQTPTGTLTERPHESKWSKIEILGHLIDSALYNIQRFNEVQFSAQPYLVTPYAQDELVLTNQYHKEKPLEIILLWKALNLKTIRMINSYSTETLDLTFDIGDQKIVDLRFMIKDYVAHLEHHQKQIL